MLVEWWAISMSQVGRARDLRQSRKLRTWAFWPSDALGAVGLEVDLAKRAIAVNELDPVWQHDFIRDDLETATVENEASVGAVEQDAVIVAVELEAVSLAHGVGQRAVREFVNDLQGVGRVTVVVGCEDAAGATDRFWSL